MNSKRGLSLYLLIFVGAGHMAYAAEDNVSKQIQQLNSQIQSQLQQIQETQQKQTKTMNTQIQAQLKQMQADLQAQIQKSNTNNQDQIKAMQTQLQTQIKQVHDEATKAKP